MTNASATGVHVLRHIGEAVRRVQQRTVDLHYSPGGHLSRVPCKLLHREDRGDPPGLSKFRGTAHRANVPFVSLVADHMAQDVGLGDDAHKPPCLDYRQAANFALDHQASGFLDRSLGRDRNGGLAHHLFDPERL